VSVWGHGRRSHTADPPETGETGETGELEEAWWELGLACVLSALCCVLCALCCVLSAVCCVLCAVCCVSALCVLDVSCYPGSLAILARAPVRQFGWDRGCTRRARREQPRAGSREQMQTAQSHTHTDCANIHPSPLLLTQAVTDLRSFFNEAKQSSQICSTNMCVNYLPYQCVNANLNIQGKVRLER
jgi:hypothetical protein